MRYVAFAVLTLGLFSSGCASAPARGWSPRSDRVDSHPEIGARFVDFTFQDQSGESRSLEQVLGNYTVLAFTKCESDTHKPVVDSLETIISRNSELSNVKVVGVNIHWSAAGCQNHDHCHMVDAQGDLGSICDASGDVHRVYRALDQDWMYVIEPEKTVELSKPTSESSELSRRLRKKVHELSRRRVDEAFEFGDRG